jgi:hypothetical protein
MTVRNRSANGECSLSAIQALMCRMGADPPGYFATIPRQPVRCAINDPGLPPPLRVVEFMRFHTVCYEGVPKNALGEPQYSPYCVGVDGNRLNLRDCARETRLSTSVVKRIFDILQRCGYAKIKKDGSIWYCGKVELRAEAAVRRSVAECLQGARHGFAADQAQRVLEPLVTGRVIAASLLKAAQAFPTADQPAVETHLLAVARWERAEMARCIARVRREAERRYRDPVWHGYRLGKVGRSWERVPAQEDLFAAPRNASAAPTGASEDSVASAASMPVRKDHGENPRPPDDVRAAAGAESSACANGFHRDECREAKPEVATANAATLSADFDQGARKARSAGATSAEPWASPHYASTGSPDPLTCVPEHSFVTSSPLPRSENHMPARAGNPCIPEAAQVRGGVNSSAGTNCVHNEERREAKPEVAASPASYAGHPASVPQAASKPARAEADQVYAAHIHQAFAGTGKGMPTDGQIREALGHLPQQASPQGFAGFLRGKLPSIRHAGALVRLAQEYAHELHYAPPAAVFQCGKCHDEGFVLPGGQYCACRVGLRRRNADERGAPGTGP